MTLILSGEQLKQQEALMKANRALMKAMEKHVTELAMRVNKGFNLKEWNSLLDDMDRWTAERCRFVYNFLSGIYQGAWAEIEASWTEAHINDDMWEYYEAMYDRPVLPEHVKLRRRQRAFRDHWQVYKKSVVQFKRTEYWKLIDATEADKEAGQSGSEDPRSVDQVS